MPALTEDDLERAATRIPDVRFAEAVDAFVRTDQASPPAPGGVLFVGDSDIRLWAPIEEYFPALPVMNRGFGGARTWEVLLYFDRLVLFDMFPQTAHSETVAAMRRMEPSSA